MTTRTPSQAGRYSRAKGATFERNLAVWLRTWWPDASRAVRNTHPDPGDIDGTGPAFWWSAKNCKAEQLAAWSTELHEKARGRIGLLVVKRAGHVDIARAWCWISLVDLTELLGSRPPTAFAADDHAMVRFELAALLPMLLAYGRPPESPVASGLSITGPDAA